MPQPIDRRAFLQSGTMAAILGGAGAPCGAPERTPRQPPIRTGPRCRSSNRPTWWSAGAGPAGVAAAIAAARTGAKTRLLEVNGCLGGVWTAGLLRLASRRRQARHHARDPHPPGSPRRCGPLWPPETQAWLQHCLRYGADETASGRDVPGSRCEASTPHAVVAAVRGEGRRLALAISESKSGRQAWAAKTFVDASGDGDLAAQAGCQLDYGREGTGQLQPMSLIALLVGLRPKQWPRSSAASEKPMDAPIRSNACLTR